MPAFVAARELHAELVVLHQRAGARPGVLGSDLWNDLLVLRHQDAIHIGWILRSPRTAIAVDSVSMSFADLRSIFREFRALRRFTANR